MASVKKKRTKARTKKAALPVAQPVIEKELETAELEDSQRHTAAVEPSGASDATKLQTWNKWLAAAYAAQGLAMLVLGVSHHVPIIAQYVAPNPLANDSLVVAQRQIATLDLLWLVAGALFVAAIFHAILAGIYRKRQETATHSLTSTVRWVGLALSTALFMIAIALISGVYDAATLGAIFVFTASMYMCMLLSEVLHRAQQASLAGQILRGMGAVAGLVCWIIIAAALCGTNLYADATLPSYVYGASITLFITMSAIGISAYLLRTNKGKWTAMYGERLYMAIVFVGFTAVAWQVFTGALSP